MTLILLCFSVESAGGGVLFANNVHINNMNQNATNKYEQSVKVMIDGSIKTFTICTNTENCKSWWSCISWDTPVARAIRDLEIGEANNVNLPNGKTSRIILLERY